MNEISRLILALLAGVLLGAFFFGGLWWTINRSMVSAQPALLIVSSFFLRTLVTIAGFYVALQSDWRCLVSCLVGFLVSRVVATRIIGLPHEKAIKRIQRGAP